MPIGESKIMARRWNFLEMSRRKGLSRRHPAHAARRGSGSDGGQAMVEYLVAAGMLLASLAILTLFLTTFKEYGYRILEMVGSDYP